MRLPQIAPDKALHVIYGAAASLVGCSVMLIAAQPPLMAAVAGAVSSLAVGAGKELRDRLAHAGVPELADAVATAAGGLMVAAPLFLSGV